MIARIAPAKAAAATRLLTPCARARVALLSPEGATSILNALVGMEGAVEPGAQPEAPQPEADAEVIVIGEADAKAQVEAETGAEVEAETGAGAAFSPKISRPSAPPSRPLASLSSLPEVIAARAARAERVAPALPRAALLRAAQAAAEGNVLRIPAGCTAIFVPADSLPCALPGTPLDDVVAFLVPDSNVDAAHVLLGGERISSSTSLSDQPPLNSLLARSSSQKSAALIAELGAFFNTSTVHERWRTIEQTVRDEAEMREQANRKESIKMTIPTTTTTTTMPVQTLDANTADGV